MDALKPSVKWISHNDSQAEKEVVAVGFFVNIVQLKDLYDAFRKTLAYLAGCRENNELFIGKVRNLTQDFKTGRVTVEKNRNKS